MTPSGSSIALSLPQPIAITSGPTFGSLTINGIIRSQQLSIAGGGPTATGIVIQAASGQSAPLTVWQNSSSVIVGEIGSLGTAFFPGYVGNNMGGTNTFQNAGSSPNFSVNGNGVMSAVSLQLTAISGSTQCLQADLSGNITGTGAACGSGGGGGGGGSPAGPTLAIQYNNAGSFGGSNNAQVDANGNLSLGGTGAGQGVLAVNNAAGGITVAGTSNVAVQAAGGFQSAQTGSGSSHLAFSTQNGDFQVDGVGNISVGGTGSVIAITGTTGGLNISADTNGASIQSVGGINLNLGATGTVGITVTAAGSATAHLTDWKNHSGTVLDAIEANGTLMLATVTGSTQCLQVNTNGEVSGSGATCGSGGGGGTAAGPNGAVQYSNGSGVFEGTGNVGIDANGNISITGTGSVIAIQGTNGGITISGTNGQINSTTNTNSAAIQTVGGFTSNIGNAGTIGLTIKAASAQSANLSVWENSSSTVIGSIGSLGTATFPGYVGTNSGTTNTFQNTGGSPNFSVNGNGLLTTANITISSITGGTAQCLHANTVGMVSGTGSDCGSGGSGTPYGPTLAIQYNNSGVFGGTANAEVDANGNLSLGGTGSVLAINGSNGGVNVTASANGASIQSTGGAILRGHYVEQNVAGTAGGYIQISPITYNPNDGSACTDFFGNPVTQPVPLTGGSFGAQDTVLWVGNSPIATGCGTVLPVNTDNGLLTNSYMYARAGFGSDIFAFNSFQTLLGGMYARGIGWSGLTSGAVPGFTTDSVISLEFHSSSSTLPNMSNLCVYGSKDPSPGSNSCYGGIGFQGGSTYWYWNSTTKTWGTVNFATVGGINSINSQTGSAITISSVGTGISVGSGGANTITVSNTGVTSLDSNTGALTLVASTGIGITGLTISNTGVTSIAGTTNEITASSSTGSVTLSLPQTICTTCGPTFGSVTASGAFNSTATTTSTAFQANGGTFLVDGYGDVSSGGSVNATGNATLGLAPYRVNGTAIVDVSRNLTNIGQISAAAGAFTVGSLGTVTAPGIYINNTGGLEFQDTTVQYSAACCTVVSYGSPSWLGTPTSTRTLPTVPGTIYQNLTGKSIIVTVVGYSSVWPATLVAEMGPTSATYITMCEQGYANVETTCSFTVPAPYYYQVYLTTAGVTGLTSWVEEK